MKSRMTKYKRIGALLALTPVVAWTAPPEPGAILQPKVNPAAEDRNAGKFSPVAPTESQGTSSPEGEQSAGQIMVTGFEFDTDFNEATEPDMTAAALADELKTAVGQRLGLRQLQLLVAALDYRLKAHYGYLQAKAWLPLQEIKNGKVTVKILKGVLGDVKVSPSVVGTIYENSFAEIAAHRLKTGAAIRQSDMEDIAYRASDYYGSLVRLVLIPATQLGQYDVMLEPQSTSKVSGYVGVDNTGNRYTSQWHDNTSLKVNNLTGNADALSLSGQFLTPSQISARLRYQLPTLSGWTLGADWVHAHYALGGDFQSLLAKGRSQGYAFDAMRRMTKSRDWAWQWGVVAQQRKTTAEQSGADTLQRKLTTLGLKTVIDWSGDADHSLLATWTTGSADLSANNADLQNDAQTAKVDGHFNKALLNYFQQRPLSWGGLQLRVNLAGQMADKNLDSSEKLSMGGLTGVRAYPYGEAMSDQGLVAQFELSRAIHAQWRAGVFYDRGYSQRSKNPWISNGIPNHYSLAGYGVNLAWQPQSNLSVQAIAAFKSGHNPAADATTQADSDGRSSKARAWVLATYSF
jgi:hemolysin activation/secretion protein